MNFFGITVKRPVAISMVVLGVVVFGAIAYRQLPLNLMPTMTYPRLTVRTEYPGSGPEEVERQISRPVESILGTVSHLVRITSHSRAEISELVIEFDWKVNMDLALQEVREKLDLLRLPEESKRPILLRYDPNLDPMMRVGLWGRANLYQLRRYAEEVIRPALETLPGVAAVKIRGGLEREVEVALDEKKMSRLGLNIQKVVQRLREENINLAGGRLKEGATHYWVRTLNEFRSLQEMEELILEEREGGQIRLKDVAKLRFHAKDQEIITRVNGRISVELSIFREADANIVDVSQRVKDRIFGSATQRAYLNQQRTATNKPSPPSHSKRGPPSKRPNQIDSHNQKDRLSGKKGKKDKRKGKKDKRKGKYGGKGGWAARRKKMMARQRRKKMTRFLLYNLPSGMQLEMLNDQAIFIKKSIDEVLQSALLGGIVAVFVLLLFLRNFWSTVIIGLSIPLSVIATFAGLYLTNVSLNIMSLGGLALGIGMLVDNSIVVLESILRFQEEGHDVFDSAVLGVSEVGGAVTASTLTTVAVFFPIVFVQGAAGQLLRDLSMSVVLSLVSSLLVSLFFIPMLSALRLPQPELPQTEGKPLSRWATLRTYTPWGSVTYLKESLTWFVQRWRTSRLGRFPLLLFSCPWFAYVLASFLIQWIFDLTIRLWRVLAILLLATFGLLWKFGVLLLTFVFRPVAWIMDQVLDGLHWSYPRILRGALRNRALVLLLGAGLAFLAYQLLPSLQREFVPKVHQGEFNLEVAFPVGTPLLQTARRLQKIERALSQFPEVQSLTSTIGMERTEVQNADQGEHTATLTIKLRPTNELEAQEKRIIEQMREMLLQQPGLRVKVTYPSLFSLRTPIEIEIKGEQLSTLHRIAKQAKARIDQLPDLRDVRSSAVGGLPEIQILYDRERLLQYGLSVQTVAQAVRSKVYGAVATRFRQRERRLDVLVRVQRPQLKSVRELLDLTIHSIQGTPIPLRQVAKLKVDEGPSQILRIGSQRAVLLRADLQGVALGKVTQDIHTQLASLDLPSGYSAGLSGQSEEMEKSLQSLLYALLLSIFLVYLVMASQFESLVSPFVILFSIPLAFIGVVFFFWWFHFPISVMVLIGFIILAGIVVNNAIVLVDAINKQRERGVDLEEAIRTAGRLRLRPILMTTLTTVLGLLPLALGLGEGSELRRPMAITIMVGLIFSTLLTLVVIPVLYRLVMGALSSQNNPQTPPTPSNASSPTLPPSPHPATPQASPNPNHVASSDFQAPSPTPSDPTK